jgi:hypothetical protein
MSAIIIEIFLFHRIATHPLSYGFPHQRGMAVVVCAITPCAPSSAAIAGQNVLIVVVLLTRHYIQTFVAPPLLVLNEQLMIWKVALAMMTRGRNYAALCRMGKVASHMHVRLHSGTED